MSSIIPDMLSEPTTEKPNRPLWTQRPHLANDIKDLQFFTGSLLQGPPLLLHLHQESLPGLDAQVQLFRSQQQLVTPLEKMAAPGRFRAAFKTHPV